MLESAKYEGEDGKIKREIKIFSLDLLSLLVDFLSEILYLVETEKLVFQKIKFKKFSDNEIEGELIGKKLKRMEFRLKR